MQNVIGTDFGDTLAGSASANVLTGGGGNDVLQSNGGGDTLLGGTGIDTAAYGSVLSTAATFGVDGSGHWTVTIGGQTDTLVGVESVTFADETFLLVDKAGTDVGGYQTVQSAIDAASGGETILIRGGTTYSEQADYLHNNATANFGGLYINTPNLTLQGTTALGVPITTAAGAQSGGPTIVSAFENEFGATTGSTSAAPTPCSTAST